MKKHKQEINITWKKTWTLQRYKERKQEHDLDLKTKMTKYMANVSFYRLRCGTIAWWTKEIVGGQPLIWWLVFDIVGCWFLKLLADFWYCWMAKTSLLTSEFEPFDSWKLWAIISAFQQKNQSSFGLLELKIWAENRTVFELQDMFRLLRCC